METIIAAIIAAASCTGATDEACAIAQRIEATPCATEDAADCFWHGTLMGNGTGRSFVTIGETRATINRGTADRLMRAHLHGLGVIAAPAIEDDAPES